MTKIVVVGSNPSSKSPDNTPFHAATRSRIILDAWFDGIPCQISYINVSNEKTPKNKSLTHKQIRNHLPEFLKRLEKTESSKVVALGKIVVWALNEAEVEHLEMPHPSGCNRLLNDPEYVAKKLEDLREYVNGRQESTRLRKGDKEEVQDRDRGSR